MWSSNKLKSGVAALAMVLTGLLSADPAQARLFRNALAQAEEKPAAPAADPPDAPPVAPDAPPVAPDAPVAPPDAPDAEANPEGQALKIVLVAAQGTVQFRLTEEQPWQRAVVGMDLPIGAEIRTGLRSICQFTIDENHTITLDRLGVVKVLDAIRKDGRVKTDVGMKYGRTQYQVETGAAEHDARVHAPSATLAVRGSFITFEDNAAFGSTAIVDHSRNAVYTKRGMDDSLRVVAVGLIKGRIEEGTDGSKKNPPTAAEVALRDTINDVGGRLARASEAERDLVATYPIFNGADPSGGASLAQIQRTIPGTIIPPYHHGGGEGGVTDTYLAGALHIVVAWDNSEQIALFANEPSYAGGKISTVSNHPEGSTTSVRSSGPAPGVTSTSGSTAFIHYNNGMPGGTWDFGVALINTSTEATIPFFVNVVQFPAGGGNSQIIRTLDGTLGRTGENETTTKITTTFQASGVPLVP